MSEERLACTCCAWVGDMGELVRWDGFDVCPECQSEVEPVSDLEEAPDDPNEAFDLGDLESSDPDIQRWLDEHRVRPPMSTWPAGTGKSAPVERTGNRRMITASFPRQEQLKESLRVGVETGATLIQCDEPELVAMGQDLLRSSGRVCVATDQPDDPTR